MASFVHIPVRTKGASGIRKNILIKCGWMVYTWRSRSMPSMQLPLMKSSAFNDIAKQFIIMERHSRNDETGLMYHGYDESRRQQWADKTTGRSPNVWGRAMGWYGMALVDALEWFPRNHPKRDSLIGILTRFTKKDIRGLLIILLKLRMEQVNLHGTVSVSGLGGDGNRDGSFEYYMSEKIVVNDQKGVGAFLMASNEMEILPAMKKAKQFSSLRNPSNYKKHCN